MFTEEEAEKFKEFVIQNQKQEGWGFIGALSLAGRIDKHTEKKPICPLCGREMLIVDEGIYLFALHEHNPCVYNDTEKYDTKQELLDALEKYS